MLSPSYVIWPIERSDKIPKVLRKGVQLPVKKAPTRMENWLNVYTRITKNNYLIYFLCINKYLIKRKNFASEKYIKITKKHVLKNLLRIQILRLESLLLVFLILCLLVNHGMVTYKTEESIKWYNYWRNKNHMRIIKVCTSSDFTTVFLFQ